MNLQIPYDNNARPCYRYLKKTEYIWQDGFETMLQTAKKATNFEKGLKSVLELYEQTLKKGQALPPKQSWKEEDAFLCCADDLLLAMFAAEAQRIANQTTAKDERERSARLLQEKLRAIPWDSPNWNEGTRPRIQEEITKILDNPQL